MRTHRFTPAGVAALFVLSLLGWPAGSQAAATPSTTLFSGRATAVKGSIAALPQLGSLLPCKEQSSSFCLVDTGNVAPEGGSLHERLLSYPDGLPDATQGALTANVLDATVIAHGDRSRAQAHVADLKLTAAEHTVSASFLSARAMAICNGGTATVSGSSEIADLVIDGQRITVSGGVNQPVSVPGIASVIINEQIGSASEGNGDLTVNAVHITTTTPVAADVIIASAHADIHCAQSGLCASKDFVTGGGWIVAPSGAKRNFAVAGGDTTWGHLLYIDHGGGPRVKGTGVTKYVSPGLDGANSRHIEGNADIDGVPGTYTVDVADNGEPGRGVDTFYLSLSTGYKAGGSLEGGNIQLHCK